MLIEVDGPSAVGKTTLLKKLSLDPCTVIVPELLDREKPPVQGSAAADTFLIRQMWFFGRIIEKYHRSSLHRLPGAYFLDIGIIHVILHTKYEPLVNDYDWDVFDTFVDFVLNKYSNVELADKILYLYATEDLLRTRKEQDRTTSRRHHEENLRLLPYQKRFFETLKTNYPKYVNIIQANVSSDQICDVVRNIVYNRNGLELTQRPTLQNIIHIVNQC